MWNSATFSVFSNCDWAACYEWQFWWQFSPKTRSAFQMPLGGPGWPSADFIICRNWHQWVFLEWTTVYQGPTLYVSHVLHSVIFLKGKLNQLNTQMNVALIQFRSGMCLMLCCTHHLFLTEHSIISSRIKDYRRRLKGTIWKLKCLFWQSDSQIASGVITEIKYILKSIVLNDFNPVMSFYYPGDQDVLFSNTRGWT